LGPSERLSQQPRLAALLPGYQKTIGRSEHARGTAGPAHEPGERQQPVTVEPLGMGCDSATRSTTKRLGQRRADLGTVEELSPGRCHHGIGATARNPCEPPAAIPP